MSIAENVARIKEELAAAAIAVGRDPSRIQLRHCCGEIPMSGICESRCNLSGTAGC